MEAGEENQLGERVPLCVVSQLEPELEAVHVKACEGCHHGAGHHVAKEREALSDARVRSMANARNESGEGSETV